MAVFERSKWIWIDEHSAKDTYGEFYKELYFDGGKAECNISCDGDYTLYINGEYVSSGQYGDYEHYKIYDSVDISPYLKRGKNSVAILVWHFGEASSRYIPYTPGVIFEIRDKKGIILVSDTSVECRVSKAYKNGACKRVSSQLGYSFSYDATMEDNWTVGRGENMKNAVHVSKNCSFYKRPIAKHTLCDISKATLALNESNTHYIFDLGKETVGLISFGLYSECETDIIISYGEHLCDGGVRRKIGDRDFSVEYRAIKGENRYTNHMLRLGCRYLEISTLHPVFFDYIGIIPQRYPMNKTKTNIDNELDRKIYDMCVHTLECCMMEHYVDCPWREQCMYAFDSRNQMLSGYYAFSDGNFEYARANLLLMSKDKRKDKLLSICFPCGIDLTIPSFSLYYVLAIKEYLDYSGDVSLILEVKDKIESIFTAFFDNMVSGLIYSFGGNDHWNFYDWAKYCEGSLYCSESPEPDAIINLLMIIALSSYRDICCKCSIDFKHEKILNELKRSVKEAFFDREKRLYLLNNKEKAYTVLANSLAIISGVSYGEEAEHICDTIYRGELSDCSLSMKAFKYDAYILTDRDTYKERILDEIRADYAKMLNNGSTTAWETIDGADAFDKAGSLCHGWSAIPIYYFSILK